jgi:hypothetical protein
VVERLFCKSSEEIMSLRITLPVGPGAHLNALDYEIAQQKAEALGRIGLQLEQVLERLRAFPSTEALDSPQRARRDTLLDEAADRAWTLMVQREMCGLRHWDAAVRQYAIPREVLNRMGRAAKTG